MTTTTLEDKNGLVAFLFPGQASQAAGMGYDLYTSSKSARLVFEELDDILEQPLTKMMFTGDIAELTRTRNAQPAIAAVSIATWKCMEEITNTVQIPNFTAGHSVGEYSLLAVTGVLSISDTIKLICERGRLMEEACIANPGSMAAIIGIDEIVVLDICRVTGVQISNINTPKQIIISGDNNSIAKAIDLAAHLGSKKAIRLKVGGAFHSSLMNPVQESLNQVIDSLEFKDPIVPIISNVTATPIVTREDVKAELKDQLQSCVRWSHSIDTLLNNGVGTFVEVGPGSVLASMVKRTVTSAVTLSVGTYSAVHKYTQFFK